MAQKLGNRAHMAVIVLCSICAIMLFAACQGVSSSGGTINVSGKILAVNPGAHSVTLQGAIDGKQQTITISDLTDQQIADLQGHINSNYSFQVSQNNDTYTIVSTSTPVTQSETTPVATATSSTNTVSVPGSISFIGKVQSATTTSLVVSMPDGNTLTMSITAGTDSHDVDGQLAPGMQLKVKAETNPDGSFMASTLRTVHYSSSSHSDDLSIIDFTGNTTSAVGADNLLHFQVGNQNFTALIDHDTDFRHLHNAQSIDNNQPISVEVFFNGGNGTAQEIDARDDN
ncbi:MAG TPA: DUF5666 domain-containing protein [Ktedonobacteraceae bacterium]|jgi:hypothetical protein|nr:DUF5666 domain-containing protein [Ktedonobacteraceae bacterium]